MRSLAWSLIALSLLGCSKKESAETPQPEPSATPAPEPSAGTAVTTQSAAPAESAAPGDPDADFVALTGPKGQHFVVGRAVVVCGGDCKFPADPPRRCGSSKTARFARLLSCGRPTPGPRTPHP